MGIFVIGNLNSRLYDTLDLYIAKHHERPKEKIVRPKDNRNKPRKFKKRIKYQHDTSISLDDYFDEKKVDLTVQEAHSVLISNNIMYAECIKRGNIRNQDKYKSISLAGYDVGKNLHFGFLGYIKKTIRPRSELLSPVNQDQLLMESKQSYNLVNGMSSDGSKRLGEGDRILVRKVSDNGASNKDTLVNYFEPVIVIRETDNAYSIDGNRLETEVIGWKSQRLKYDSYEEGDMIKDLPIVAKKDIQQDNIGLVGVGYVPAFMPDSYDFGLRPVFVKGAARDIGKIVRCSYLEKETYRTLISKKD